MPAIRKRDRECPRQRALEGIEGEEKRALSAPRVWGYQGRDKAAHDPRGAVPRKVPPGRVPVKPARGSGGAASDDPAGFGVKGMGSAQTPCEQEREDLRSRFALS